MTFEQFCNQIITGEKIVMPQDAMRLARAGLALLEQRDGYKENYWALVRPSDTDRKEITEDEESDLLHAMLPRGS